MNISFEKVKSILKTLPISYYTKVKIEYELSDYADASYFEPVSRKITISYKQIMDAVKNTSIEMTDESLVRTLLYHETSHALLTPSDMIMTRILNVFEDERIETLLQNFYHDVNFKAFCKKINNFDPNKDPQSVFEMFYDVVRFRHGPKKFTDRVEDIIIRFQDINSAWLRNNYYDAVNALYLDIKDYFLNQQSQNQNQNQDQNQDQEQKQTQNDSETQNSSTNETNDEHDKQTIQKKQSKTVLDCSDKISDALQSAIEQTVGNVQSKISMYVDTDIKADFDQIISSSKKLESRTAGAINAYSGVFDPRSVIRTDYKYFTQKNRTGHIKQFSKTHLNLFIDKSGSFCANETLVNKMLSALVEIERSNPDFTFDLICCGIGQTIMPRTNRRLTCGSANSLTANIFSQFRSVQVKQANVINIVLFDGDAFSVPPYMPENFRAFDSKNTIIISDEDNKYALNSQIKTAKVIITKNYTKVLYENVKNALQILLR